ncbi:hypothetical protein Tco_0292188 [Tanacetum coccineum]
MKFKTRIAIQGIISLRNIRYGRLLALMKKMRLQAFKTNVAPRVLTNAFGSSGLSDGGLHQRGYEVCVNNITSLIAYAGLSGVQIKGSSGFPLVDDVIVGTGTTGHCYFQGIPASYGLWQSVWPSLTPRTPELNFETSVAARISRQCLDTTAMDVVVLATRGKPGNVGSSLRKTSVVSKPSGESGQQRCLGTSSTIHVVPLTNAGENSVVTLVNIVEVSLCCKRKRGRPRSRNKRFELINESFIKRSECKEPGVSSSYIDLVDCTCCCKHCKASFWYEEHFKGGTPGGKIEYHKCCGGGKAALELELDSLEYTKEFFRNKHLMENILIIEQRVKVNQKAHILELKRRNFEEHYFENLYVVSIKKDTAYPCPNIHSASMKR